MNETGDTMQISSYMQQSLSSLRQAIGMANLRQVMDQDAQSVDNLVKAMEAEEAVQREAQPHKGGNKGIRRIIR